MLREIKTKNLITSEADFFKINDLKNIILYQYDSFNQVNDDLIKLRAEIKIAESKLHSHKTKTAPALNLTNVERVDSSSTQNQTNRSTQRSSKNVKEESILRDVNLNSTSK